MAELFIEIFTEELPAIPLLKNLSNIKENWKKILKDNHLDAPFDFFYTPRRLSFIHKDFALKQPDTKTQSYGPPLAIAYDSSNNPTKAMQSFLQKNNITKDMVKTATKDNKEVLFYEKEVKGIESSNLLESMVITLLHSLHFGKSMRWGDCKDSFIRPIRNICIVLDNKNIPCNAYNIQGNNLIFAHRQAKDTNGEQKSHYATSIESYLDFLSQNGVILDQDKRKDLILQEIKELENKHNIKVEIDTDLLQEIVAITEYPHAMLGIFDEKFLKIPKEMIITSMKENQRYFAVYKDSELFHGFVVVSNSFGGDFSLITKGNEKVLRARLEDAMFFYTQDIDSKMEFGSLDSISFMEGAGSLADKIAREQNMANSLIALLNTKQIECSENEKALVIQALKYAKCDLLSQSVGEFPELQGIMGSYFAKDCGMESEVCLAIREQYLPNGIQATLPSSKISALVNMANKLDTIFTLFNINKIPSGSKDPFALRRQAAAILKIAHQFGFDLSIKEICNLASKDYSNAKQDMLIDFMMERIYGIFPGVNPSIVRCVLLMGFGITQSFDKILALASYFESVDIKSVIGTFKRVANILDNANLTKDITLNTSLFEESETKLYNNLMTYAKSKKTEITNNTLDSESYLAQIESLFSLKDDLDSVFDNVLIMTDNVELKQNRIGLITLVFKAFMEFGDMREIAM